MKRKRPYRLGERAALTDEPPFSVELVQRLLEQSQCGPKGRRTHDGELSTEAIRQLCATLNQRHALFYCAQQDRARKERRDRAMELIGELRKLWPEIVAEQQTRKADEFFSRQEKGAVMALRAVLNSNAPETALAPVELPQNILGWQWCAASLYADLEPMIGANAAVRFISLVVPQLTGERSPALSSVWASLQNREAIVGVQKAVAARSTESAGSGHERIVADH